MTGVQTCALPIWGRHTLETRMNGTWHDIPNTNHLREKWRRKEGGLKEYITKGEKLNS